LVDDGRRGASLMRAGVSFDASRRHDDHFARVILRELLAIPFNASKGTNQAAATAG